MAQQLPARIEGAAAGAKAVVLTMVSDDMDAVNSFAEPTKLSPVESSVMVEKGVLSAEIPAHAFAL